MSRCFPFPPPGYETRSDHVDLPKHKEKKKHKKEKKKREKKEKDKSKDKHREKKQKHKDENNRDASESRVPQDRNIDECSEGYHGVKLGDEERIVDAIDTQFTARIKNEENGTTKKLTNFTDSLDAAVGKEKEKVATNGKVPISVLTLRLQIDGKERSTATAIGNGRASTNNLVQKPFGSNNMVANLNGTATAIGNGRASTNNLVQKSFGNSNMVANLNGTATAVEGQMTLNLNGKEQIGRPRAMQEERRKINEKPFSKDTSKHWHEKERDKLLSSVATNGRVKKRKDFEKKDFSHDARPSSTNSSSLGHKMNGVIVHHPSLDSIAESLHNRDASESRDRKIDEYSEGHHGVKLGDDERIVDAMDTQFTARIKNEDKGTTKNLTNFTDSLDAAVGKEKKKVATNGKVPISILTLRLQIDGKERSTATAIGNGRASTNNLVQKPFESSNMVANLNDTAITLGNGRASTNNLVPKPVGQMTPNLNGKEHNKIERPNGIGRPLAMQEERRKINEKPFSKDNSEHEKEHDKLSSSVATNGSVKKRKDFEKKNFTHDARPSKFMRATNSSSHIPLGHKMNGVIVHHPSVEKKIPSKRVHSDIKYLSKIYSIPDTEELPDSNEEWLFIGDKPKVKAKAEGTPQVWAEALKIDLEDIIALPYVVPF